MATSKAILITGCSSGIWKATALKLARDGNNVYATGRTLQSIEDLKGCKKLALDVGAEDSMKAAVAAVEDAEGAVGVLVNMSSVGGRFPFPGGASITRRSSPSKDSATSCVSNSSRSASTSS